MKNYLNQPNILNDDNGEKIRNANIMEDEFEVLEAYRKAKNLHYADLLITIQEGMRVKLWLTEKKR